MTLRRERWRLPESLPFGDATLKPLGAGESVGWRLDDDEPAVRTPPDGETVAGWLAQGETPGRWPG